MYFLSPATKQCIARWDLWRIRLQLSEVFWPIERLNRQLSCRCSADSLPRDEGSNVECSRSKLWSTGSSCSFPCAEEPTGLRLALCCKIRGIPRQFLMVKGGFSFREQSKVEAVPSENAWPTHTGQMIMFLYLFADHAHPPQTQISRRPHTNSELNYMVCGQSDSTNFPLLESLDEQRRLVPAETERLTAQP